MKVSVVIPAYNAGTSLRAAVQSCLTQGDAVGEIIIVENGSVDGTRELATGLAVEYPDLIFARFEPLKGSSGARNAGIRLARYDWVQFLDADDELLPGKIDRQLPMLADEVDWVMGNWAAQKPNDPPVRLGQRLAPEPWKGFVYNGGLGNMNSNLFRKSTLEQLGGFNEKLVNGIDMDLYLRLLIANAGWVQDHEVGSIYHLHDGERLSKVKPKRLVGEELGRKVAAVDHLQNHLPEYYAANRAFFRAAILRGIRQQYTQDVAQGRKSLQRLFPKGVQIKNLDQELLPTYAPLYPILGFDRVERFRCWFRGH